MEQFARFTVVLKTAGVAAYCLMSNHYHLVLETPNANLVAGMAWLQSAYTIRLNHRHKLIGHVLSGRYKAQLVEGSGNGLLAHRLRLRAHAPRPMFDLLLHLMRRRDRKKSESTRATLICKGMPCGFRHSNRLERFIPFHFEAYIVRSLAVIAIGFGSVVIPAITADAVNDVP
jgi:hypothetical protein